MIMCFLIAMTEILKHIGRIFFSLISLVSQLAFKIFVIFISISFEIVYLSSSQPGLGRQLVVHLDQVENHWYSGPPEILERIS